MIRHNHSVFAVKRRSNSKKVVCWRLVSIKHGFVSRVAFFSVNPMIAYLLQVSNENPLWGVGLCYSDFAVDFRIIPLVRTQNFPPLIHTRMYKGVRNVNFPEDSTYVLNAWPRILSILEGKIIVPQVLNGFCCGKTYFYRKKQVLKPYNLVVFVV